LAAGLLGFMIDGGRTLLIAGTRSAGKTSLLSSLMVQILRSTRVITVEDTLELPVDELKKLDYDIQSLKVKSVITGGDQEIGAAEGIRTSLRMGDSSLIVGEVRSTEALALYEAMRVGALANVVAGTIHGDSPYGVFDRVVNDLKVPPTSFKATDIIVVCNPIKSASGLQSERRVVQITEVRKNWDTDPLKENGFVDLMVYNPKTDQLEPTDALLQGESEILKSIASRVRSWAGDYDAIWQNIELRAKIVQTIVDAAAVEQKPALLESDFLVMANDEFHRIMEDLGDDAKLIYSEWLAWFKTKGSSIE
jgi:archaeal flagellar protein FlaI